MKGMFVALAVSSFVFLAAQTLRAQEGASAKTDAQPADPKVTMWTKEKIDNPPAREIKFEVLEKPEQRKLFRADAKLLEQKYVAQISLKIPQPALSGNSFQLVMDDEELRELLRFGDRYLTYTAQPGDKRTYSKSLKAYLERIPAERRAMKDEWEFFASDDTDAGYLLFNKHPGNQYITDFHVLARTQEEAKQRASSLLALLDLAVAQPVQRKLLAKHMQLAVSYREQQKALMQFEAELSRLQKELSAYARLTNEMLSSLRQQGVQLNVDAAGINARLAACDARLEADIMPDQRKQLEALKLTAEIELAGCEARRAATERFVEQAKTRNLVAEQLAKAQQEVSQSKNNIARMSSILSGLQHALDDYRPLPLVDGKVVIQPIEWTSDNRKF